MARDTGTSRFEIYRDFSGRYRWRLRGRERWITADSPRSYATHESAREAARLAKTEALRAAIGDTAQNGGER